MENQLTLENSENKQETKEENEDHVKNMKRKKTRYFETYISKLLKIVSPEHGITANAKQQLNSAVCIIAKNITGKTNYLTFISKKKTTSEKEVRNATRLLFSGSLLQDILTFADESVQKYAENIEENKHSSRQDKAGIIFPASITEKFIRNFGLSKIMVTRYTPIYFAAVLEKTVNHLLTNATRVATENNRLRLTIRDLELAVCTNSDLQQLFNRCNLSFVGGGVLPQIHESLLTKKPRRKRKIGKTETQGSLPEGKKNHRFRPGTVSLREIRKFQKASNCLIFAKFPFERLVRRLVNNYQEGMKISKEVFVIIQYYIEQFLVDLLRDANAAAIHSGRVKLMPSDINFITKLRKYPEIDVTPYKPKKDEEVPIPEHKE